MHSDDLFETVPCRNGPVTFFANDTGAISESLRKYGEWAENELSFMLSTVRKGDTVIDVGGYIGTHSLAFARHVGDEGRVVSIEAQARSFELLKRNIESNGLNNVRLENAIASSTAKQELIPSIDIASPGSYGSASLREVLLPGRAADVQPPGTNVRDDIEVQAIAIDDLPVESCALIKIDVEGMEDMVLRGATQTVRRWRPTIYAECNSLEDGLRTLSILKELDYRVRAHVVLAYNTDNFRQNPENIFGGAREVALVGCPRSADPLAAYELRSCEMLLDIETADDLALALMNKPQYEGEVLRLGAAAQSGGTRCLDEIKQLRADYEQAKSSIELLQKEMTSRMADADRQFAARLEQNKKAHAEMQAQIELARQHVARAEASESMARAREVSLQATLAEIYQSSSWKMTAPFRALKKSIR